jgi:hypothetical protein
MPASGPGDSPMRLDESEHTDLPRSALMTVADHRADKCHPSEDMRPVLVA